MELKKIPVRDVINGLDRLFERDAYEEAGKYLKKWLLQARELGDWSGELTLLNEWMGYSRNIQDVEGGLQAVEEGFALLKEHALENTVTAGTTWLNGATTMKAFGKTQESIPYYEKASRVYHEHLDPGDYRLAGLYNNMALAYTELGQYPLAEQVFARAEAIMKTLPGGDMELAVTQTNLACLYEAWQEDGYEEKIDSCIRRAMAYLDGPEVKRDGYYAFTCRKCAGTFGHFGYFKWKKELEERADAIYERA